MNHKITLLVLAILVGFAGGCTTRTSTPAPVVAPKAPSLSPVIDRIRRTGVLRVGMAGDYPPLNVENRAGKNIGLEPDLAKALAGAIGARLEVVPKAFAELIPALEAGQIDMAMSGMTMTSRRNLDVAFAGPYFISGKAILTRAEELDDSSSRSQLDQSDVRLAALRGTTSQGFVEKQLPKAQLTLVDSYREGVELVTGGEVHGLIADYPVCVVWTFRAMGLATLAAPLTFEPIGIAMPPEDPLFVNLVQNYLRTLQDTGLLKGLQAKWFEDASWVNELP